MFSQINHPKLFTNLSIDGSEYSFEQIGQQLNIPAQLINGKHILWINQIENDHSPMTINIFPNPIITDYFNLYINDLNTGQYLVSVYNLLGAEIDYIAVTKTELHQFCREFAMPSNLPNGIYFVKFKKDDSIYYSAKFI